MWGSPARKEGTARAFKVPFVALPKSRYLSRKRVDGFRCAVLGPTMTSGR